jgi:cytochrome c oxidase subunit 2
MTGSSAQSVLRPASATADTLFEMGVVLTVGAGLIFVLVMGLLALALRRRPPSTEPINPHLWIIGGGVVFPVLVLSALMVYASVRTSQLTARPDPKDALVIGVTAKLWWWEVRYRDPATGRDIVLANEIRVPAGRAFTLALSSEDVIHSFWVPELAGKVDMVPGRLHHLHVEAREPGTHRGQCAEYCGDQHALMALHVIALPQDEFHAWLAAQARPAQAPKDELGRQGREAFLQARCNACHTIRGVAEEATLGPDLTHVGSRLYLGAGTLPVDRGTLSAWIADTQGIKPGARMPSFGHLGGASLKAIGAYLEQLE